jgi:hypothetical protein
MVSSVFSVFSVFSLEKEKEPRSEEKDEDKNEDINKNDTHTLVLYALAVFFFFGLHNLLQEVRDRNVWMYSCVYMCPWRRVHAGTSSCRWTQRWTQRWPWLSAGPPSASLRATTSVDRAALAFRQASWRFSACHFFRQAARRAAISASHSASASTSPIERDRVMR